VQKAAEMAEAGDVVLLSPGGTSFDEFKDFEERGQKFRELVNAL
jgi:UDP-N-acetylmuramoylalanine--D-glutamate ligase